MGRTATSFHSLTMLCKRSSEDTCKPDLSDWRWRGTFFNCQYMMSGEGNLVLDDSS